MEDFKNFSKKEAKTENLKELITSLAGKYNGKDENEILAAILKEAEKGRKNGTLKDSDIDNFAAMLSPLLNAKQKEVLKRVVKKLKET